jgi:predicted DNA-binding helix-hairpin-helix protein
LNTAAREVLLQVPGIGPKGADSILRARRQRKIKSLDDLQKLGIIAKKSAPYVLLDGRMASFQMRLMDIPEPPQPLRPRFPG